MNVRTIRGACLAALTIVATSARGDDRFWSNGLGGAFHDEANWDDGASGVPGATDVAIFDVAAAFDVAFPFDAVTDRLLVKRGIVTFEISGSATYALVNGAILTPSVVVGEGGGDVAELVLIGALHGAFTDLGQLPPSVGTLHVDGPTSLLLSEQVNVGAQGVGLLEVSGGGNVAAFLSVVGRSAGSYGEALVSGAGSAWSAGGLFIVAKSGAGSLVVESGGLVTTETAIIAQLGGASGIATVRGTGSRWLIDDLFDVGMNGFGELSIEDGAEVISGSLMTIGTFPAGSGGAPGEGGRGDVTVAGAGSRLVVDGNFLDGDLYVGLLGIGRLAIETGAGVRVSGRLYATDNSADSDFPPIVARLSAPSAEPLVRSIHGLSVEAMVVEYADSYVPADGDAFVLAQTEFPPNLNVDALTLPPPPPGRMWSVAQNQGRVTLALLPSFCAAAPEDDCNANGADDTCDLTYALSTDCDENGEPDECDVAAGNVDCNGNGLPDSCDLAGGASDDCDGDALPDECAVTSEYASLLPADAPSDARFGYSIDADGDRLIVGALGENAAYVYHRSNGEYLLEARLTATGTRPRAVAIDGDFALVSALSGAHVFRRDPSGWIFETTLTNDELGFFWSLALDGNRAIVAGTTPPSKPDQIPWVAEATIYRRDAIGWVHETTFSLLALGDPLALPGASIAGDVAAVAWRASDTGEVSGLQIHRLVAGAWLEEASFESPMSGAEFGPDNNVWRTIATDGSRVFVGGRRGREFVFVYHWNGTAWHAEQAIEVPGDPPSISDLSVSGDTLAVGIGALGLVHVFRRDGETWHLTGSLAPSADAPGAESGSAVAVLDHSIAVGAPSSGAEGGVSLFATPGTDCNANGTSDACDIAAGNALDDNSNGIPDVCEDVCPADLDGTGDVGFSDLISLLIAWGPCGGSCPTDIDLNGKTGFSDLVTLLLAWGPCT